MNCGRNRNQDFSSHVDGKVMAKVGSWRFRGKPMETKVLVRPTNQMVTVDIGGENKPEIRNHIKEKWQKIINLVADLLDVPAGLIMQITETHMKVFLKSQTEENPYAENGKDKLLNGLYCETVIGTDESLLVENSLDSDKWKDNPDVKLNLISYYGLPLKWPDGSFFGTICVLDHKAKTYGQKYRQLLLFLKEMIETDLMLLERNSQLEKESIYDALTLAHNRRKFDRTLEQYVEDYIRHQLAFSLILIDIDSFKRINDSYGHVEGDKVLRRFSELIMNRKRKSDIFSRYGGDEFTIITKVTDTDKLNRFIESLLKVVAEDSYLKKIRFGIFLWHSRG